MYHPLCHTTFTVFSIIIVVTSTIRSGWAMRQRAVQQPQQQASDSDDSPPPKLPLSSPFAGRVSEYAPPQQKGKGKEGESSTSPLLLHQHQSQPAAQLGDGDGGVSCPCEMLGHLCSPRAWANCFRRSGDWIKDQWSMVGKQCAPPAELKRRLLGNKEQQGGEQAHPDDAVAPAMGHQHHQQQNKLMGILVEGLERSDYGQSLDTSDYQRSRAAAGYCACPSRSHLSLAKVFYEGQETDDNHAPEAIRILCRHNNKEIMEKLAKDKGSHDADEPPRLRNPGMAGFCACTEEGLCYQPFERNPHCPTDLVNPTYVELAPFCDHHGCHVFMEMYAGPQPWTDGCKPAVSKVRAVDHQGNVVVHEQLFNPGPVGGHPSPYLKVVSVSCNGCANIRRPAGLRCAGAPFVEDSVSGPHFTAINNNNAAERSVLKIWKEERNVNNFF